MPVPPGRASGFGANSAVPRRARSLSRASNPSNLDQPLPCSVLKIDDVPVAMPLIRSAPPLVSSRYRAISTTAPEKNASTPRMLSPRQSRFPLAVPRQGQPDSEHGPKWDADLGIVLP